MQPCVITRKKFWLLKYNSFAYDINKLPYSWYVDVWGKNRIGYNMCRCDTPLGLALNIFDLEVGESIMFFPSNINSYDALADYIKLFPSRGQAKKANWNGNLPIGFSSKQIKQKHVWLWLYVPPANVDLHNPMEKFKEYVCNASKVNMTRLLVYVGYQLMPSLKGLLLSCLKTKHHTNKGGN